MYELVKTARQQKKFQTTWEYFCDKYKWVNDPYAKDGVRYNLLLHKKGFYKKSKVIGTIEFIPYNPQNPNSTVEGRFNFSKYDEIARHQQEIWEIDKVCIHQDYQRQGYIQIFSQIIYEHAAEHRPKCYLALIEKKLYRWLKFSFGSYVKQKGTALDVPTTSLIPAVLEIEEFMKAEEAGQKLLNL